MPQDAVIRFWSATVDHSSGTDAKLKIGGVNGNTVAQMSTANSPVNATVCQLALDLPVLKGQVVFNASAFPATIVFG